MENRETLSHRAEYQSSPESLDSGGVCCWARKKIVFYFKLSEFFFFGVHGTEKKTSLPSFVEKVRQPTAVPLHPIARLGIRKFQILKSF